MTDFYVATLSCSRTGQAIVSKSSQMLLSISKCIFFNNIISLALFKSFPCQVIQVFPNLLICAINLLVSIYSKAIFIYISKSTKAILEKQAYNTSIVPFTKTMLYDAYLNLLKIFYVVNLSKSYNKECWCAPHFVYFPS